MLVIQTKKESTIAESEDVKPLKILILGGTSFLGPHQIAYAMSRGHSITTFTRGKTKPTVHQKLFDDIEMLVGDRENDLSALEVGTWDVVIDNSGHNVEWTKASAELLKDRSEIYMFTSSTGVFYPYLGEGMTEETEVLLEEPEEMLEEEKLEYWYGVMKSNSEIAARNVYGEEQTIVVRPTYMMGPADKSDRFIHWPIRLAKGADILVPGKVDDPVQYIDVRDVAEFMIRLAEQKMSGTYNAVGPEQAQTMMEFVEEAREAFDVESNLINIQDYEFLKEQKIYYLVPWIPAEGKNYGSARISNSKAIANGLTFRDVKTSVKETHDWWYSDALTDERRAEVEENPESVLFREKEILEDWKKASKG